MARKKLDCRRFPSETGCSLVMIGEEDELLRAATQHAIQVHGDRDTPELRKKLRSCFEAESTSSSHSAHV